MSPESTLDVVVIGNSILDLVWSLERPLVIDGKVMANRFSSYPGGQGANAAYTLGRLGLSVDFVGMFGDDEAGALCKQALRAAGVTLTTAQTIRDCASQTAAILVDAPGGTRTIAMYRPAGFALTVDPRISSLAERARLVYVDGYEPAAQLVALQVAGARGRIRLADIEVASEATRALACEADHLIIPLGIAAELSGEHEPAAAVAALANLGPLVVIATAGAAPLLIARGGAVVQREVPRADVLDTTGVGDAFRAAYAAALLAGISFDDCLEIAFTAAGWKCRTPGPRIVDDLAFEAVRSQISVRGSYT